MKFLRSISHLVLMIWALFPNNLFADQIHGQVVDDLDQGLPQVNIILLDTDQGTTTDITGLFFLTISRDERTILYISRVGYESQTIAIEPPLTSPLLIRLEPTLIQLPEVTVEGTLVRDLTTPITFTSLSHDDLQARHMVEDIPTLLSEEPGVYVSNDFGTGFGDSQIMIRGFDEKRIQVMVNNIPVNDPETKEVPWSSWSALPDAAQTIQVQRGVGTSLYGTGAIGGAINIVTLDAPIRAQRQFGIILGAHDMLRFSLGMDSGLLTSGVSLSGKLAYIKGSGWRDNTYFEGLQYYLSLSKQFSTDQFIKIILHGAPQYHTLAFASMNAASYGDPEQFSDESLRLNDWGLPAFGFGRAFNANVHTNASGLSDLEDDRRTSLLDALFFQSKIGADPSEQVGGYVIQNGRVSMNNNVSHRPQLELHHRWKLSPTTKLNSTLFYVNGLDYSDDVYPAWYIPRTISGLYDHETLIDRAYWGGNEVFEYRYYSDFTQIGFLSALNREMMRHEFSLGMEARHWTARHAGEVLNIFGADQVNVPMGSILHPMSEADLFYDFTTTKPQATLFARSDLKYGPLQVMGNIQLSAMSFRVLESVPSNSNYPNHLDSDAASTHGAGSWSGSATYDHDSDPLTPEEPVVYTLWDFRKAFQYITPRLGISYALRPTIHIYGNYSIGVKEPEIKHFYGFGAPRDDLELEQTQDLELGLNARLKKGSLSLTAYSINFAGKLMQITIPEKANTPGYDYAGHTYVPVGDARYAGIELTGQWQLTKDLTWFTSASVSENVWGEPDGTEGAQKLYGNVAIAGEDFQDLPDDLGNLNGRWDEGGREVALHGNFVEKYGARYDVGMPQLMVNNRISYNLGPLSLGASFRYFRDIYILENNDPLLVDAGTDNLFFTADDVLSPTLPAAFISDLSLKYQQPLRSSTFSLKLKVSNLFNEQYWQRGDEFGLLPGAPRTWLLGIELTP